MDCYHPRMLRRALALSLLSACRPAASGAPAASDAPQTPSGSQGSAPPAPRDHLAACEAGDAEACADHGMSFQFPAAGPVDLASALELYDRSCAMGYAWGCVQAVGILYYALTPRDDAQIEAYARRACELKHADACTQPPDKLGGVMPKAAIRNVVRGNIEQVRACYNAGLAQMPTLAGRVKVRFTIEPDGRVGDVALIENVADVPDVGQCIGNTARQWRFPPPFGRVIVDYPFVLEPG